MAETGPAANSPRRAAPAARREPSHPRRNVGGPAHAVDAARRARVGLARTRDPLRSRRSRSRPRRDRGGMPLCGGRRPRRLSTVCPRRSPPTGSDRNSESGLPSSRTRVRRAIDLRPARQGDVLRAGPAVSHAVSHHVRRRLSRGGRHLLVALAQLLRRLRRQRLRDDEHDHDDHDRHHRPRLDDDRPRPPLQRRLLPIGLRRQRLLAGLALLPLHGGTVRLLRTGGRHRRRLPRRQHSHRDLALPDQAATHGRPLRPPPTIAITTTLCCQHNGSCDQITTNAPGEYSVWRWSCQYRANPNYTVGSGTCDAATGTCSFGH